MLPEAYLTTKESKPLPTKTQAIAPKASEGTESSFALASPEDLVAFDHHWSVRTPTLQIQQDPTSWLSVINTSPPKVKKSKE